VLFWCYSGVGAGIEADVEARVESGILMLSSNRCVWNVVAACVVARIDLTRVVSRNLCRLGAACNFWERSRDRDGLLAALGGCVWEAVPT
jgi:hypothetical protein